MPFFRHRRLSHAPARSALFAALLASALSVSGVARAQDELQVPESCGTRAELVRAASAMRASDSSPLPAVRMRADRGEYLLEVDLPDGTRTLRDADCAALFRAAIVISALGEAAFAPEPPADVLAAPASALTTAPPPPVPPTTDERTQPAAPTPAITATAPSVAESQDAQPPARLSARALLGVEAVYGITPKLGARIAVGSELARGRFRARLALSFLSPSTSERVDGVGVRVYGLGLHVTAEGMLTRWLALGGGADLQGLNGRSLGALRARRGWITLPLLHAELTARLWERGRVRLDLPLGVLFAPARARFVVEGRGTVYRNEAIGFRGGLRVSLQFL